MCNVYRDRVAINGAIMCLYAMHPFYVGGYDEYGKHDKNCCQRKTSNGPTKMVQLRLNWR